MFQMLKDNPNLKKVYLCLDNDEAGRTANRRIQAKLQSQGIQSEILIPHHKDWNEELLNPEPQPEEESKEDELCLTLPF